MRRNSTGFLVLFGLGSFFIWRNRYGIQRFLEAQGINIPLNFGMRGSVGENLRSGMAKVSGSVEHGSRVMEQGSREMDRDLRNVG